MNKKDKRLRFLLLFTVGILAALFFYFDLQQYVSLQYINAQKAQLTENYHANPLLSILIFMGTYILLTSLSFPGAAVLTLCAGTVYGFGAGTVIVSFASTIGATFAFLIARFLLRDFVQNRYDKKLKAINEGFKKEGVFYLFALRLVPIGPFFLINILMGLTPIRTTVFFFVSQIGMLPGTMVYVYAGSQLAEITTLSGILSPEMIAALTALGLLPLVAKKSLAYIRRRKV